MPNDGHGHYPPATGGRKLNEATLYDILGPIFGSNWKKATAIVMAESGGDTHARNVNSDGSVDRGAFQINSRWHPEVPDAVCYNIGLAARAAYIISKRGTDWSQWATNAQADPSKIKQPDNDDAGLFGIGRGKGADTKVTEAADNVGGFLGKLSVIFQGGFWLRAFLIIGGAFLLGFGIIGLGKQYVPKVPIPLPV